MIALPIGLALAGAGTLNGAQSPTARIDAGPQVQWVKDRDILRLIRHRQLGLPLSAGRGLVSFALVPPQSGGYADYSGTVPRQAHATAAKERGPSGLPARYAYRTWSSNVARTGSVRLARS